MTLAIGTPPQNVTVLIDTGSDELWVNPTCESAEDVNYCKTQPQFDYTQSSSLQDQGFGTVIGYGSGNTSLVWVTDTIKFGSAEMKNQWFGVSYSSSHLPVGTLGLGPPLAEPGHAIFLDNMASQGLIKSRAFSLGLRSVGDPFGSIIFGGIDTGKFIGSFSKLPIIGPSEAPNGSNRFYVNLTGIGLTTPDGVAQVSSPMQISVNLDSGGSVSKLPTPLFQAFGQAFPGATLDSATGYWNVDCSLAQQAGTVDYYFGDKVIRISYADFIVPDKGKCILGVIRDNGNQPVLGDSFLRAAFAVYDVDNRNIHLAQAANCGNNLVAISSGTDAVPSVTGDCSQTSQPTATVTSTFTTDSDSMAVPTSGNPEHKADPTVPGGLSDHKPSVCASCGKSSATASSTTASPSPTGGRNDAGSVNVNVGAFAVGFLVNLGAWLA